MAVIDDVEWRSLDSDIGLADSVDHLTLSIIVVPTAVEEPCVGIDASISMLGLGEIEVTNRVEARGGVDVTIVGDSVRAHPDASGISLADGVDDRTLRILIILTAMEEPRVGVDPRISVLGLGEIEIANWVEARGGVDVTIVGDSVRAHLDARSVGPADDVRHPTTLVIIILTAVEEPFVGIDTSISVLGPGKIEITNRIDTRSGVDVTIVGDSVRAHLDTRNISLGDRQRTVDEGCEVIVGSGERATVGVMV